MGDLERCQLDLAALLACSADTAVRDRTALALGQVGADSEAAIAALQEAAEAGPARLQRLATASLEQLNVEEREITAVAVSKKR